MKWFESGNRVLENERARSDEIAARSRVAEPCGFVFDGGRSISGENLEKVKRDLAEIAPIIDAKRRKNARWRTMEQYLRALAPYHGTSVPSAFIEERLTGEVIVNPLTAKLKPRKFPVSVKMMLDLPVINFLDGFEIVDDKRSESMIVDLDYFKDGSVGKARVIFWKGHYGIMYRLAMIDGKLDVKEIKRNSKSSGWV